MKLHKLSKVNVISLLITSLSVAAVVYIYVLADGIKQELDAARNNNVELRAKTAELPTLQRDLDKYKKANSEKEAAINNLAVKNDDLTQKLAANDKELKAAKQEVEKSKKSGEESEKELTAKKAQISELQQQLAAEKERSESLNGELVSLRNSQEAKVVEDKEIQSNSQIEERDAKIADLNKQLDRAQFANLAQFEDFQKEKAAYQKEIAALKAQIENAAKNPREKSLEENIKKLNKQIEDLKERCEDLDQQNRDLRHRYVRR
ncbi:MAG: hypothetical protein K6B46_06670 [Opitutales bacterium]|nr:hypothetical protein [Opitutales bacterium]